MMPTSINSPAPTDFWTVRRRVVGSYTLAILLVAGLGAYAFTRLSAVRSDAAIVAENCLSTVALASQVDHTASRVCILIHQQQAGTNTGEAEAEAAQRE